MSLTHSVKTVGYEILEPLVAKASKLNATFNKKQSELATFVMGDFIDSVSTPDLQQARLVFLTSMCWDEGLVLALHKKLVGTLSEGCLVVDYTKKLQKSNSFELMGSIPVQCSWSDSQCLYLFKKTVGASESAAAAVSTPKTPERTQADGKDVVQKASPAGSDASWEKVERDVEAKGENEAKHEVKNEVKEIASSPAPPSTTTPTTPTIPTTPKKDESDCGIPTEKPSPISPVAAAGICAAGLAIGASLWAKVSWKKK